MAPGSCLSLTAGRRWSRGGAGSGVTKPGSARLTSRGAMAAPGGEPGRSA